MSDYYSFGAFLKQRSVLGDLSNNRNGKRGLPLNHGSFTLEKGNGQRKNIEGAEKDKLPSWIYIGLDNKGKENISPLLAVSENATDGADKILPFVKAKRPCHSLDPDNSLALSEETVGSDESKEALSSLNGDLHPVNGDTVIQGTMEGEGSRDGCISSSSAHAKSDKTRESSPVLENLSVADGAKEGSVRHAFGKNENEKYGRFFALSSGHYEFMDSQLSSMVVDAIPSQESGNNSSSTVPSGSKVADAIPIQESVNNLTMPSGPKVADAIPIQEPVNNLTMPSGSEVADVKFNASINSHGGFNMNDSSDLEKACSCSFCMKAAYLWSDLNYHDLKGRLAALSKSMRHARLLVRNYSHDDIQRVGRGSSNSKLEFDLINQWKSLFHHTEDILVRESAQIQTGLSSLSELRRNCERDLEMAIRMHPDKP